VNYKTSQTDYYRLQFEELIHPKVKANNVIIGTSHATYGIEPGIINKPKNSFYNFALNGSNPEYQLRWYQTLFKTYYPKPQYMIIAVDWFLFDSQKLWRNFEQDAEYFPEKVYWNCLRSEETDKSMLLKNRYPIIKYRKTLLNELLVANSDRISLSEYDDGYIPSPTGEAPIENFIETIQIDKNQQQKFEELIKTINNDQIKIILIVTPTYNTTPEAYKDIAVYSYFDSLACHYSIPYLNYNTQKVSHINLDKKYYADGGHLNHLGSTEFSKLLSKDLDNILK